MTQPIRPEELMRYLDGESDPEERARIEAALGESTEVQRDMVIFRSMKEDLTGVEFDLETRRDSVWDGVNRQLTRPMGWIFLVLGTVAWAAYGSYLFLTSTVAIVEKLAVAAMVIGILLLLLSVIWEQYRVWLTDPYRDVQR